MTSQNASVVGTSKESLSANDPSVKNIVVSQTGNTGSELTSETEKKLNANSSEQSQQDENQLDADNIQDEEEIAELVTDVIKKEPELLQRIMEDEEVRELVMVQQMSYRGPLPPSELLSGYEAFCPGSTDRFIGQLEANQKHQHVMEISVLTAQVEKDKENRKYAFHLTIGALISSVILGLFGHDWLAGTIATTTIIAILATFILNRMPGNGSGDKQKDQKSAEPSPPVKPEEPSE